MHKILLLIIIFCALCLSENDSLSINQEIYSKEGPNNEIGGEGDADNGGRGANGNDKGGIKSDEKGREGGENEGGKDVKGEQGGEGGKEDKGGDGKRDKEDSNGVNKSGENIGKKDSDKKDNKKGDTNSNKGSDKESGKSDNGKGDKNNSKDGEKGDKGDGDKSSGTKNGKGDGKGSDEEDKKKGNGKDDKGAGKKVDKEGGSKQDSKEHNQDSKRDNKGSDKEDGKGSDKKHDNSGGKSSKDSDKEKDKDSNDDGDKINDKDKEKDSKTGDKKPDKENGNGDGKKDDKKRGGKKDGKEDDKDSKADSKGDGKKDGKGEDKKHDNSGGNGDKDNDKEKGSDESDNGEKGNDKEKDKDKDKKRGKNPDKGNDKGDGKKDDKKGGGKKGSKVDDKYSKADSKRDGKNDSKGEDKNHGNSGEKGDKDIGSDESDNGGKGNDKDKDKDNDEKGGKKTDKVNKKGGGKKGNMKGGGKKDSKEGDKDSKADSKGDGKKDGKGGNNKYGNSAEKSDKDKGSDESDNGGNGNDKDKDKDNDKKGGKNPDKENAKGDGKKGDKKGGSKTDNKEDDKESKAVSKGDGKKDGKGGNNKHGNSGGKSDKDSDKEQDKNSNESDNGGKGNDKDKDKDNDKKGTKKPDKGNKKGGGKKGDKNGGGKKDSKEGDKDSKADSKGDGKKNGKGGDKKHGNSGEKGDKDKGSDESDNGGKGNDKDKDKKGGKNPDNGKGKGKGDGKKGNKEGGKSDNKVDKGGHKGKDSKGDDKGTNKGNKGQNKPGGKKDDKGSDTKPGHEGGKGDKKEHDDGKKGTSKNSDEGESKNHSEEDSKDSDKGEDYGSNYESDGKSDKSVRDDIDKKDKKESSKESGSKNDKTSESADESDSEANTDGDVSKEASGHVNTGKDKDNDDGTKGKSKCAKNEEYYPCGIPCPQTCAYVHKVCRTKSVCRQGHGACGCRNGDVRNSQNKCVNAKKYCKHDPSESSKSSSDKSGSNGSGNNKMCKNGMVYYSCPIPCPQTCKFFNKPCNRSSPRCIPDVHGVCGCRAGDVLNEHNKCVSGKKYCHEHSSDSDNSNDDGKIKCGPNQMLYQCGIPCPQTCENVNKKCKTTKQNLRCSKVCGCLKGYVRNKTNNCVSAKTYCKQDSDISNDEGQSVKCPANQKYYRCGLSCPQTCHFVKEPCNFKRNFKCKPKRDGLCGCIKDYVRNDRNKCVPAKEYCDQSQDDDGEHHSGNVKNKCCQNQVFYPCGLRCSQTCENIKNQCEKSPRPCKPKEATCGCIKDYVRNKLNKCVKAKDFCNQGSEGQNSKASEEGSKRYSKESDKTKKCKQNQMYYPCGVGCPQTCEYVDKACYQQKVQCRPGNGVCGCIDGFVKSDKGKCVSAKKYCNHDVNGSQVDGENHKKCKRPNEQYYPCGVGCPQSCKDINQPCFNVLCKRENGKCLCRPGFVRNKQEKCVNAKDYCNPKNDSGSSEETDKQCKYPHEQYYPCGVGCPQSCDTLGQPCMDALVKCRSGKGACLCKPGYVRNNQDKCVKAKDYCKEDSDKKCKYPNEQYYPCGVGCPQSCKDQGQPCEDILVNCIPGKGACLCKPGYVRNKQNKCIEAEDYCQSNGDASENSSENENNNNAKKCSPKRNEQLYRCGLLCPQNCKNVNKLCVHVELACNSHKGICECREGYVRNENDNCVDAKIYCKPDHNNTTKDEQCKGNEQYYTCGIPCGAQTCEMVGKPCNYLKVACKGIKGACGCHDDYVRDKRNKCVLAKYYCNQNNGTESSNSGSGDDGIGQNSSENVSEKCNANEMFYKCGRKCPETCAFENGRCEKKKVSCKPSCGCLPGFVRNEEKKCVSAKGYCCGRNEERLCQRCERQCGLKIFCERKDCVVGCYCKDGYARDANKKCVKIADCDHNQNATYD